MAWIATARLELDSPALYGMTFVGAFAVGLIVVTIAMALVSALR